MLLRPLVIGVGVGYACIHIIEFATLLMIQGFYVNLPVGAVAVVAIILLRIPQQTVKPPAISVVRQLHHYLDLIGFVLFAPAVLQLLLALQYGGNQFPWNSSRVIGLFCGSAANFVVWFFWNWHKGDGGIYFLPIYFQAINAASPMLSGVYLLPTILPQLVMAASSGLISKPHPSVSSLLVANIDYSNKNGLRNTFGVLLNNLPNDCQRLVLVASTW